MKLVLNPRRIAAVGGFLVVLASLCPSPASADAPGVRGPEVAPVGDVASPGWQGIQPLPPITGVPAPSSVRAAFEQPRSNAILPAATIYGQAEQPVQSAAFSLRELHPGNWVLDAGLGILSTAVQSIQQTLLGFVAAVSGVPLPTGDQVLSLGCNDGALGLLFCTKPDAVLPAYDVIGPKSGVIGGIVPQALHKIWLALQPAAFAVLTLVFTVRLGRVMHAGPAAFQSEVKALLLPFLAACALVAATPALLRILLSFFAALNTAVLGGNLFGTGRIEIPFLTYVPTDFIGTLSLGPTYALTFLFVVLFIAIVVALVRLAKLTLLIAIGPLAGATLIDRSTAPLFGNWFSKVLELLLHQFGWSVTAMVGSAILSTVLPNQPDQPTDTATFVVHTVATGLVLLLMLCQQQLFSGVFQLATGGTSPVMGGAVEKANTYFSARDGIWRKPSEAGGSGGMTASMLGKMPVSRPAPVPALPAGLPGWYGGSGPNSKANGQPGARARASTQLSIGGPSKPAAAPVPPVATATAGAVAPATAASIGSIDAGRMKRLRATLAAVPPPAASMYASSQRVAVIRSLQAQATQTGYQAWRAAPAALAREARWNTVHPPSVADQRALSKLKQRSSGGRPVQKPS